MIAARPLTIAEIFDRTVTLMVRRWRIVLAFAVCDATPNALAIALTRGHDETRSAVALGAVVSLLVGSLTFSPLVRLGGDPGVPDDLGALLRGAVRDYGRSLGSLVVTYLALVAVLIPVVVLAGGALLTFLVILGPAAAPITMIVAAVSMVAAMTPCVLVASVAYANVILDRVGPWRGLTSAVARVGKDSLPRAWLLGAALLVVSLVPLVMLDSVLRPLAASSGLWWLLVPAQYLTSATGIAFATVAGAVAAVDYRNRHEGADLHAVLDAPAPAS